MGDGINVNMGVSGLQAFKRSIKDSETVVKSLDKALVETEKAFKTTGDAQTALATKSEILKNKLSAQNKILDEAKRSYDAMVKSGVNQASAAFQEMQARLLAANSAVLATRGELDQIGDAAAETAQKTNKLTDSLNGINKKVSFDAVLNGIGKITDGMEAAAKKVASLARDVWDTMAMAASWADNENTLAAMSGIDVETLQRMQGASRTIDTTVETIIKSQQKLKQNMVYGSDDVNEAFQKLGVSIGYVTGKGNEIQVFRDATDVFWEAGEALKTYADEVERDAMAQKIFGSSWRELLPLFTAGRQEYEKTLSEQSIVTEENVNKLNQLDDALQKLDQDYQATKNTILSELAPAFTVVAGGLSDLIGQVNEYLKTDEGKEKMEALGQSVTDLFNGITDVDFEQAIETAGGILDSITGALGWIKDNHTDVENAIKGIGTAFVLLKAAEVVGTLTQAANGLKGLLGGGSAAAGGGAAVAGGAAAAKGATVMSMAKALAMEALPFVAADAAVIGAAVAPAVIAQNQDYANAEKQREERMDIAERNLEQAENDAAFLLNAASALGLQRDSNGELIKGWLGSIRWGDPAAIEAILSGLQDRQNQQLAELYNTINQYSPTTSDGNYTWNQLQRYWTGEPMDLGAETALLESIASAYAAKLEAMEAPKVEVDPVLPDDAAAMLEDQLGPITVDVIPNVKSMSFANGLPYVPFDGYVATLHKGERVVPANQNKNYNNTSNVYFDHVNVNNGIDADGLAARIAEHNRRTLEGFGG